ncbi:uncharacterized protein [Rutidosis leptorrhynchoides]|uniref:uncharacterized protein n=1 Tax=Rutidosis leptorrhynchoides TaxID=125765 RepID=UPI003A9A08E9
MAIEIYSWGTGTCVEIKWMSDAKGLDVWALVYSIREIVQPSFNQVTLAFCFQNGDSLSDHYHKLNALWKQFDALLKLPTCGCNNTEIKEHNDLIKLMQFLMGLDECYHAVRSNILTREKLPSVQTAFSIVSREESHRDSSTVRGVGKSQQSAFLVSKTFDNKKKFGKGPNTNLKCTKCNLNGHTIDRCYEIIGYPPGWDKRNHNNSTSNSRSIPSNNSVGQSAPFTPDQINKLMNLINDSSGNVHANVTGTFKNMNVLFNENFQKFFKSNNTSHEMNNCTGWIIDSGASQHMTGSIKNMKNLF